jgi:hypothetical protein
MSDCFICLGHDATKVCACSYAHASCINTYVQHRAEFLLVNALVCQTCTHPFRGVSVRSAWMRKCTSNLTLIIGTVSMLFSFLLCPSSKAFLFALCFIVPVICLALLFDLWDKVTMFSLLCIWIYMVYSVHGYSMNSILNNCLRFQGFDHSERIRLCQNEPTCRFVHGDSLCFDRNAFHFSHVYQQ